MRKNVEKLVTYAHLDCFPDELERRNRKLARRIAAESIVMLENNGVLPLDPRRGSIALYGVGSTNTIKGGSGSGEVNNRKTVSIYEGMKKAGFQFANDAQLHRYASAARQYRKEYHTRRRKEAGMIGTRFINMSDLEQGFRELDFFGLGDADRTDTDTCIYIIARMSGEGADRRLEKGDYYLTDRESSNLHWCAENYKNVILVFNTGGPVDLSSVEDIRFAAILNLGMPGEEGGNAFADVISGKVSPSGHLTDTWPMRYADIPFGGEYAGPGRDPDTGNYKEDIFVGYRYYERFSVKPRFCFGRGLSYTDFRMTAEVHQKRDMDMGLQRANGLEISVTIENTGARSGKCVPQIYMSAPENRLKQPQAILVGYGKTGTLRPGEKETLVIKIPYYYMSSFDEANSADIMEEGQYAFYLGEDICSRTPIAAFRLQEPILLSFRESVGGTFEKMDLLSPDSKKADEKLSEGLTGKQFLKIDPAEIRPEQIVFPHHPMDDKETEARTIVEQLKYKDLVSLLVGDGIIDIAIPMKHRIVVPGVVGYLNSVPSVKELPQAVFCDGPAGLRFCRTSVIRKGEARVRYVEPSLEMMRYMPGIIRRLGNGRISEGTPLYMFATAFPTGTALAQTWNEKLITEMGDAIGSEMDEYGVTVWLAPGMNIHRNPLCGRNYEYYSEDPIISGKTAAALVRGVQAHPGKYATIKHLCCNNQEDHRKTTSANVSERALRDIYLKGFGLVIKEADCRALMTCYNRINGVWGAVKEDILQKYIKDECGFRGFIVTDWDSSHPGLEAERAIEAGVTLHMPGNILQKRALLHALKSGRLDVETARKRAIVNVQMLLSADPSAGKEANEKKTGADPAER